MVWRASDPTPDRYGDRVFPSGMDLGPYRMNPVLLWGHDSGAPPVGTGAVWVEGEELFLAPTLSTSDARAAQLAEQIAAGEIRAVSIGFLSHESAENEHGGVDHTRTELLEISFVSVPANPNAVRIKSMAKINTKAEGGADETPEENPILEALAAIRADLAAMKAKEEPEDEEKETPAAPVEEAAKRAPAMTAKQIAEAIEKGISDRMNNLPVGETRSRYEVGEEKAADKGILLARFVKAKAVAAMEHRPVRDVLKGWGDRHVTRALSQGSFGDGGSLVLPQFSSEFIELLRNETVIRKAGARQISMPGGNLTFGGQESAASAGYVGEKGPISESSPKTSQPLVLSEKKLAGLVPLTNDLIRNASISAEAFVRDDLVQVMAVTEDSAFLYGDGTQFAPKGIKLGLASGHRYAMSALAAAGVPTVAEVKKELAKALRKLKTSKIPVRNWAWFLTPAQEQAIIQAVGPGAEGTNSLEREMAERGTLLGHKFYVSTQIADNGTIGDLFLLPMDQVVIGDSLSLELEVFPNAAWVSGGNVVSGISTDQSVIRAIAKHDIGLRYDVAGVCVTGVTWGNA